jgi:phosphopantothenoylcysteine decarboxylase / phosphopantothenate---cysteine ligase
MKHIVLGVSGSIAAYKSVSLVRLLIKAGYDVKVIMTPSATSFVAPLTFATLSKHPVFIDVIDGDSWNNHVDLGLWADAFVVAPATASTISKMAAGQSDNMLVATYLSAKCPVYIAPAMDLDMWKHPATQANIKLLESYSNHIIPVGHGELASGLVGAGRMAEPEDIVAFLDSRDKKKDLTGKIVMITAGPTREPLDPVRYISNHSTGRMGIAIADECQERGATVYLILGPTDLRPSSSHIHIKHVQSAEDMYEACIALFEEVDIAVFAAAVADYTPEEKSDIKIKKKADDMHLPLKRTQDIAGSLGQKKRSNQITVGFALETNDESANAQRKLDKKNFDFIVLNSLREKGAGFKHDTNKVTIYSKDGSTHPFLLKSKRAVAKDIIDLVVHTDMT